MDTKPDPQRKNRCKCTPVSGGDRPYDINMGKRGLNRGYVFPFKPLTIGDMNQYFKQLVNIKKPLLDFSRGGLFMCGNSYPFYTMV